MSSYAADKMSKEEIVISGISGRYPESDNMTEFAENLLAGRDLLTEDDRRWEPGFYDLPKRHGKLKTINKFDADFFGVTQQRAMSFDPQLRILLETAYEAMMDAGVNPKTMRGTNTGVIVGASSSETEGILTHDLELMTGESLLGCTRSMFANQLSYHYDFHGPSFTVDTACSSSLLAMQLSVDAIRKGDCDAALVCGAHLNLLPNGALEFLRLNMLSKSENNACRSFDASGDGYVRSEAIGVIFLQKVSAARRCYATVVHAKSNTDGYKESGITVPSGQRQAQLLREIYGEAGIDPNDVDFLEAHGTGTPVGDPMEADAVTQVLCTNRKSPLLIGSVKSVMGHAEPSSGMASLSKVIIAMESGIIPPNLHYKDPNPYIPGLVDGRLQVVTKPTPWNGGIVGINSFGFGGSNTHIVLKSYPKSAVFTPIPGPEFPKLILQAGRTEEAMQTMLDAAKEHADNPHFHELLSEELDLSTESCPYRGYVILNREEIEKSFVDIQKAPSQESKRDVWFVYSGMGTQWTGMGQKMMVIEKFRDSIQRCSDAVRHLGIDPYSLIMSEDKEIFKNTLNCMVCITAIQISLTDILHLIGLEPNGILGHSTGEMACGYADGCMTLEQTMLCSYYRGHTMVNGGLNQNGGMAAVGLTWEETKKRAPEGVYAACHNGHDSVSISGYIDNVENFVNQLKAEDIFAKAIDSSGVPFHSPMMQKVKPTLTEKFSQIITDAKPRSERWISTSIPEEQWDQPLAQTCSAEYQVNNVMSPVLFYEALLKIPSDAVTIEVAPHALMQAILRRSLESTCTNVGLMKRNVDNPVEDFLQSLGRIYQSGVLINVKHLYPTVNGIVPNGTPMISPLIKWEHSHDYEIVNYKQYGQSGGGVPASCTFSIDPYTNESKELYLLDHVIDGKPLFPFVGYIVLAWKTISKCQALDWLKTPVILHEINVYRATLLNKAVKFDVVMLPNAGKFEITSSETDGLVASGYISLATEDSPPFFYDENPPNKEKTEMADYSIDDLYKEIQLRGYEYGPAFKGVQSVSKNGQQAQCIWTGHWMAFLDNLLQLSIMAEQSDSLSLPARMRYMRIDPVRHQEAVQEKDDFKFVDLFNDFNTRGLLVGGVEMRELDRQVIPRSGDVKGQLVMEKVHFVKYQDECCLNHDTKLRDDLNQYRELCLAVLAKGLNIWSLNDLDAMPNSPKLKKALKELLNTSKVGQSQIDAYLENPACTLVYYFNQLFNEHHEMIDKSTLIPNLTNIAIEMLPKLDVDMLWAASFLQRSFKSALDTTIQNMPGHAGKFGWLEPLNTFKIKEVIEMQLTHPYIEADWVIIGPNVELLNMESVQNYKCSTVTSDLVTDSTIAEECKRLDFVVADKVLSLKADIEDYVGKMKELMRDDGMALVIEITKDFELGLAVQAMLGIPSIDPTDTSRIYGTYMYHGQWMRMFEESGLKVVGYQTDPSMITTAYLLRKVPPTPRDPVMVPIDDLEDFTWIDPLQKAINERLNEPESKTIWLTSTKTRDNGTAGLSLCLQEENSLANRIRFLDDVSLDKKDGALTMDNKLVKKAIDADLVSNHYRDGHIGNFCGVAIKKDEKHTHANAKHAYVDILSRGDLSTLKWVEGPDPTWNPLSSDQRLCSVYYASINFRDVLFATGRLEQEAIPNIPGQHNQRECSLGIECSGRLNDGRRVMCIVPSQALSTSVVTNASLTWNIPDDWSLEEAATVPLAYCTAYYALICRGHLLSGERVLIHSGAGGVGQAAIAIALSLGCEVYTTVGTDEKKKFLQEKFPKLDDRHFSNSRSTVFEKRILRATRGTGVDVILNSLYGVKQKASVRCLAQHGRFLELGKVPISSDASLGMSLFLKNVSFQGILMDRIFTNKAAVATVSQLLHDGITQGVVTPLPRTCFLKEKVEDAFRLMASGKHVGKVIIQVRTEENGSSLPPIVQVRSVCRTLCHPHHVYLITGGLGGFGFELGKWLVSRGAKKLILTSRKGVCSKYQAKCIAQWRNNDISVTITKNSLATEDETRRLIEECQQMGGLGGLFHLAALLQDSLFEDQQVDYFKDKAGVKYWGTKYLDKVTREICGPELKWLVCFSSISSSHGNAGQSSYAWANSAMERVMEQRYADGLAGMAIQWGAIGDVGMVMDQGGDNSSIIAGTLPQRIPSCLNALETFITMKHPIVSSFVRADASGLGKSGQHDIYDSIAHILGMSDSSQLDENQSLTDHGLDSLMGVELKQVIEADYNMSLSMKDIRRLKLRKLKAKVLGEYDDAVSETTEMVSVSDLSELQSQQLSQLFELDVHINEFMTDEKLIHINEVTDGSPVFFVHSIEGLASPLKPLADELSVPAYCFQSTSDQSFDSIRTTAESYVKVMKEQQPTGPYSLVGYSFGACIAFEMAALLQQENKDSLKYLVFLNGSQYFIKSYYDFFRQSLKFTGESLVNNSHFETELICGSILPVSNINSLKLRSDLNQAVDWQARVDLAADMAMDTELFENRETIVYAWNSMKSKFVCADEYKPEHKFEGTLHLIRAKSEESHYDTDISEAASDTKVHIVDGDDTNSIKGENVKKSAEILTDILQKSPTLPETEE